MLKLLGKLFFSFDRFKNRCISAYYLGRFKSRGGAIYIGKNCIFTPEHISCGDHVYIGANCVFQSAHGEIEIGNHVMFGPGVHIHGGNHKTSEIGVYMDEVKKEQGIDGRVVIEDDVWVGSNAIILHGVHIGEGAVIGAGSVVTKDVEPYSIVVGNPGKKVKDRFPGQDYINAHKEKLLERKKMIWLKQVEE